VKSPRVVPLTVSGENPETDLAASLHEVSNALTVVLGWLERARAELPGGGEAAVAEALDVAWAHANLGHSIARRAVEARPSADNEVRSCFRLVQSVLRGAEPLAERRGVQLSSSEDGPDAMVSQSGVMQQILLNLLFNAIAFTPPGKTIEVDVRTTGGRVCVSVLDGGPGVPLERRANLFRRGATTRPNGAGIGLAHAHALAKRHGGQLQLLDRSPGACFQLLWPQCEAPSTPLSDLEAPNLTPGLRVLVLEDDPAVMTLLELGLVSRGLQVIKLGSRADLMEFSRQNVTVDVALVDLSPIASDPQSALKVLRRAVPSAPIFLVSGSCTHPSLDGVISGWIRKPFELSEVYRALARVSASVQSVSA
jgi:CheY-like chemotaxis protein